MLCLKLVAVIVILLSGEVIFVKCTLVAVGNFSISLTLYKDSQYQSFYTGQEFPVSVKLRQALYLQLAVQSSDSHLAVFIDRCLATPGAVDATPQYLLLDKGCKIDSTIQYTYNKNKIQRFSIAAFRFTTIHPKVYFHCFVEVCLASDANSRCAQGCQGGQRRRRRSSVEEHSVKSGQSLGPFVIERENDATVESSLNTQAPGSKQEQPPKNRNPVLVSILSVGAVTIFLVLIVATAYGIRTARLKRLTTNNEQITTFRYCKRADGLIV